MKKLVYFFIAICSICFSSCSKQQEGEFWGISYGMTHTQVDSVIHAKNYSISDSSNNGIIISGNFDAYGISWNVVGVNFRNDTVSSISLGGKIDSNRRESIVREFKDNINTFPKSELFSPVEYQHSDDCILWSGRRHLLMFKNGDALSITIFPKDESTEEELREIVVQANIESKLTDLTEAMTEYTKAMYPEVRNYYGDKVIECNKYLKEHVSQMTPRQKEWYNRLLNVSI